MLEAELLSLEWSDVVKQKKTCKVRSWIRNYPRNLPRSCALCVTWRVTMGFSSNMQKVSSSFEQTSFLSRFHQTQSISLVNSAKFASGRCVQFNRARGMSQDVTREDESVKFNPFRMRVLCKHEFMKSERILGGRSVSEHPPTPTSDTKSWQVQKRAREIISDVTNGAWVRWKVNVLSM